MTKQLTKKAIVNKINNLNKRIDIKIVNGKDYSKEAQEHKDLLVYLRENFNN